MVNSGQDPAPGYLISWFEQKVNEAIDKHGLTTSQPPKPALPPDYENPRKLPASWLQKYLNRKPEQLAVDVIRAHDSNFKLARENHHLRTLVWILSLIVGPFVAEVVKLLFRVMFK